MKKTPYDYIYVGIQLILFIAYVLNVELISINSSKGLKIIGILLTAIGFLMALIAILQLNRNITPFPSPKDGSSLITNGVFAYARHPIYGGLVLGLLGYALFVSSFFKVVIVFLLFVLFIFKSNYEEKQLSAFFPDYDSYKSKVKKIIPFIY